MLAKSTQAIDRVEAVRAIRLAAWQSLFTEMFASSNDTK
jgi:hypothetical protein